MVKRTFFKECLRSIRGSISRFLAIFAIVALGTGFLAGLLATTPDMQHSVSELYHDTNLFDLRIAGSLGMEEGDAEAIAQVEGVSAVMPARMVDREVLLPTGDGLVARIHGVTGWEGDDPALLNRAVLHEGRWPENPHECVVELENNARQEFLKVGETVTLMDLEPDEDGEMPEDPFRIHEFTITGIVTSGYYISTFQRGSTTVGNGTIGCIVYIDDEALDMDYYTDVYASVEGADAFEAFSDEYSDFVEPVQQRVEALAETQKHVRADRLVNDANQELADAKQELKDKTAEGQQELDDALKELTDGEQEYADGLKEIEDNRIKLEDAAKDLAEAEEELPDALKKLQDGEKEYADGLREIEDNQKKLDDASVEIRDGKAEFEKGRRQYESGVAELEKNRKLLEDTGRQLDEAQAQLDSGRAQLEAGEAQLNAAQAELDAGYQQIRGAQRRLDEAQSSIDENRKQLEYGHSVGMIPDAAYQAAKAELDAAQQQLDGQQAQLNAQKAQLDQGQAQLNGQKAVIDRQKAALRQGQAELDAGRKQYEAGLSAFRRGQKELSEAGRELDKAEKELFDGETDYRWGQYQLDLARDELKDARAELDDGWAEYRDGVKKLEDGKKDYAEGVQKLADAEIELKDARVELDDGWAEYEDGKQEFDDKIADANVKIRDAEDQIAEIEDPEWFVLDRAEGNEGCYFYSSDTEKVAAIAKVFPVFFFAVAALVASTTMTRMIDEDRGSIGTLKALGYSNAAIAGKYLLYAFLACALGSAVGLAVGLPLFPRIIANAYNMLYQMPEIVPSGHFRLVLISFIIILAAIVVATLGALRGSLRDNAAALMRPKAPPAGKRILLERVTPIWSRMKFTHKVTARNLFRYKKRFFMTIVGIAGCTALLLAGFGLRDSIRDIVHIQFSELQTYSMTLNVKHEGDHLSDRRLAAVMNDKSRVESFLTVHQESGVGVEGDRETDLNIIVPSDEERISEFRTFRHRTDHSPIPFPENGVLLNEKAARVLGLDVGDRLTLRNQDDVEAEIPVAGICENYVFGYVFLSEETYEQAFGKSCEYTTVFVKTVQDDPASRDAMAAELLSSSSALGVGFASSTIETFDDMLGNVDYIVVVLIISAAVLAFVVLYNLTNINICERQKEIATLKVLGFYRREVSGYIFREIVLLSLLGTAIGLGVGVFFHQFLVQTAEIDAVMFGRVIKPVSYLFSAALTLCFTALVNLAMRPKLHRIDMVESLKAPE